MQSFLRSTQTQKGLLYLHFADYPKRRQQASGILTKKQHDTHKMPIGLPLCFSSSLSHNTKPRLCNPRFNQFVPKPLPHSHNNFDTIQRPREILELAHQVLKALANCANMLANILTNIVGLYVGQHVGAVSYRNQHVGEEKRCRKMLANIY